MKFLTITENEMVTFQVIPDRKISNNLNYRLLHAIHETYLSINQRINRNKLQFTYRIKDRFWYDIVLSRDKIEFYFTTTKRWETYVKLKLDYFFPHATIKVVDHNAFTVPIENTDVIEMKYKRHDVFSLRIDRREDTSPIGAILNSVNDMREKDIGRVSIAIEPYKRTSWNYHAERKFDDVKEGKNPKRLRLSYKYLLELIFNLSEKLFYEVSKTIGDILEPAPIRERRKNQITNELRGIQLDGLEDSIKKKTSPTFYTWIRIAVNSTDIDRRDTIIRSMSNAYSELAKNNELEMKRVNVKIKSRVIEEINNHRITWRTLIDLDKNVMSHDEVGKLMQLPSASLQEEYEQLNSIEQKENHIDDRLLKGGVLLGESTFKGDTKHVYQPVKNNELTKDELSLPIIVIGGMGQGKTKGFGANRLYQFVMNNLGGLAIDPAKGEIGDELEKVLSPDKMNRINLGETIFALDFPEVNYSPRAKNRLANTIISFFDTNNDDTGGQTRRFIRAAVMGMKGTKLSEILKIFEDEKYRKQVIKDMPDSIHKSTLTQFDNEGVGRQRQILSPIYNRLDMILGDEFLEQCFNSDNSLDMVKIISERKATIIDVPKKILGSDGVDLVVNLLSLKLDLAMVMRDEKDQFPYTIIIDEPHQYMKSADIWKRVAVESRKYRLNYVFMFHEWLQVDYKLRQIIKSALPHYFIYPTTKHILQDMKEEIKPYEVEEALKLKRFHALSILRTEGEIVSPFICRMTKPPSEQKK